MTYETTLLMTRFVTRDVKQFIVERPKGLGYEPGQGVEMSILEPGWEDQGRPFTPTGLAGDEVLEFTIKRYPQHQGVTDRLHALEPGARLGLSEAFGTITYLGPGVFIAGGAGVTPFLAILRDRARRDELGGNALLFSNKTPADVICERELRFYLGKRCILTCTEESMAGYDNERIGLTYLQKKVERFDQAFYVCGPPKFVDDITAALKRLGANPDTVVIES
jgi:ferredoxin-NADP reductase